MIELWKCSLCDGGSPCYGIVAKGYGIVTLGGQLRHQVNLDARVCEKSPNSRRGVTGFRIETWGDLLGKRTVR